MGRFLKGKADSGMLYVIVIMLTLTAFSFFMAGGSFPEMTPSITPPPNIGKQEIIFEQVQDPGKKNLQLQTFQVKNTCESKTAVDFLIDVSGSMRQDDKIGKTKNALTAFTARMTDSSVVGIQIFSDALQVREIIPLSLYKDVKTQVNDAIRTLPTYNYTSMRSGFNLANQKLSEAISQNKYPGYKYNLVLLSDGVPEIPGATDCVASGKRPDGITRCFARAQDPRVPSNIPQEIKGLGVDIYSIGITSSFDTTLKSELLTLLRDVSSDPDSEFFYESVDGNDLTVVLDRVLKALCN